MRTTASGGDCKQYLFNCRPIQNSATTEYYNNTDCNLDDNITGIRWSCAKCRLVGTKYLHDLHYCGSNRVSGWRLINIYIGSMGSQMVCMRIVGSERSIQFIGNRRSYGHIFGHYGYNGSIFCEYIIQYWFTICRWALADCGACSRCRIRTYYGLCGEHYCAIHCLFGQYLSRNSIDIAGDNWNNWWSTFTVVARDTKSGSTWNIAGWRELRAKSTILEFPVLWEVSLPSRCSDYL